MRRPFWLTAAAALACGATLWPTTSVKVNSYVPDLYGCAAAGARSLKYKLVSTDSSEGRFQARRDYPLKGQGPDPSEYNRADVLNVEISKSGKDTTGAATLPQISRHHSYPYNTHKLNKL